MNTIHHGRIVSDDDEENDKPRANACDDDADNESQKNYGDTGSSSSESEDHVSEVNISDDSEHEDDDALKHLCKVTEFRKALLKLAFYIGVRRANAQRQNQCVTLIDSIYLVASRGIYYCFRHIKNIFKEPTNKNHAANFCRIFGNDFQSGVFAARILQTSTLIVAVGNWLMSLCRYLKPLDSENEMQLKILLEDNQRYTTYNDQYFRFAIGPRTYKRRVWPRMK